MDRDQNEGIGKVINYAYCFDEPGDLKVSGTDSDSFYSTPTFMIARCDPRRQECKTEKQFNDFVDNLLISTVYNT